MNHGELLDIIAARSGVEAGRAGRVISSLVDFVAESAALGHTVRIPGLGWWLPRSVKPKRVVAPDGTEHVSPARVVLKFRAERSMRDIGRKQ